MAVYMVRMVMDNSRNSLPDQGNFCERLKPSPAVAVGLLLAAQSAGWFVWWSYDSRISLENGPMETFQAMTVLAGTCMLSWRALRDETVAGRILFEGLALFYATFVLSEIDTRPLGSPIMELVFDGLVRNLLLGVLWTAAVIVFLRHRTAVWRLFYQWIMTRTGRYLIAAGCFWLVSGTIDKLKLFPGTHHFHEELPETCAAILMFLAAKALPNFKSHPSSESLNRSAG